ncbi:MAG: glycogen synthase GlgA [Planctomycetes bacterium]|nr:glycogen synthase GlgA [Planctomycetota bacterium]
MNLLIASSEVAPFAKTGGLADVVGSLPKPLHKLGHDVAVIMPLYRTVRQNCKKLTPTKARIEILVGREAVSAAIMKSTIPGSRAPIYFVDCPQYYDRDELYGPKGKDYPDNAARFIFFSRAVLETIKALEMDVDVIHCNDWQTGLIPVYLKTLYKPDPALSKTGTVFTIHNLAYQGLFWHWDMKLTGLSWSLFNWGELEFFGKLNLMKGGLVFADVLNTVSKTYAKEIQTTDEFGKGLEGILCLRSHDLYGIVNGVDYDVWNPAKDPLIPANYSPGKLAGKGACKKALQKNNGLPTADVPLIGMIGRLDPQKGWDLVEDIIDDLMKRDLQLVILGTGMERYHKLLEHIAKAYPDKAGVNLTFDNRLAHEIEAGADMFLMPSRYEPCGLNQLYSLKYGTVPIVRRTGGLADTIVDCTPASLDAQEANGFSFGEYSTGALLDAIDRALAAYADRKVWAKVRKIGMKQDWSWKRSAKEYEALYGKVREKHRAEGS